MAMAFILSQLSSMLNVNQHVFLSNKSTLTNLLESVMTDIYNTNEVAVTMYQFLTSIRFSLPSKTGTQAACGIEGI